MPTSAGDLSTDHDIFDNYTDEQVQRARETVDVVVRRISDGDREDKKAELLEALLMLGLYTEEVEP